MERQQIPRGPDYDGTDGPAGHWSRHPDFPAVPTLWCPGCGRGASLYDHAIRPDGSVVPSVVCPFDGCQYHEFVTLQDWEPPGTGGADRADG